MFKVLLWMHINSRGCTFAISFNVTEIQADWTKAEDLASLLENDAIEFSLWDAETGDESHSGILKMRYLETHYNDYHESDWRPVCNSEYISPSESIDTFAYRICQSMNFAWSSESYFTQLVGNLFSQDEILDGYPVICYEQEEHKMTCVMTYQLYCYVVQEGHHEEEVYQYPSYFLQIYCDCSEGFRATKFGCKLKIM